MKHVTRIETERLLMRPWTLVDAPAMQRAHLESGEHLAMMGGPEAVRSPEWATARITSVLAARDRGERFPFAAWDRVSGELVGASGLIARYGPGGLEIGYWVHAAWIRRGIATEMAAALTRVAFEVGSVPFIEIRCSANNAGSAGVPRKLGYRLDATLPRRFPTPAGELEDVLIFSLHAEDYGASAAKAAPVSAFDFMQGRLL